MEKIWINIETIFNKVIIFFQESHISVIFLFLVIVILALNTLKRALIRWEKKNGTLMEKCLFLTNGYNGQDCNHVVQRQRFKKEKSCEGCPGKIFNMTDEEAESRIASSGNWKKAILLVAKIGNDVLPYISFVYTLIIAFLESAKGGT